MQEGELRFCPKRNAKIPADRVSEWSIGKSEKIRFFDKPAAIALARSLGVFRECGESITEDLSDEALFAADGEE